MRSRPFTSPVKSTVTLGAAHGPDVLDNVLPLPDAQLAVEAARYARQKFFDLHTHRGGG
jgi:hypothetical protein